MKHPVAILVGLAMAASTIAANVYLLPDGHVDKPDERRVLFFGIDGGTWTVMQPMIDAGELPNLAALQARGYHGVLKSRRPAISPTAWSTIFTGKLPDEHGVDSWQHSQTRHRRVKAVWNITSEAGVPTHVFNVPSTWPPEDIDGVMVSGFPVSGSHVQGVTGLVVDMDALEAPDLPRVYRANLPAIREHLDTPRGTWSDWFDVKLGRKEGQMTLRALSTGEFWLSPFYRTDAGLDFTSPVGHRYVLERDIGRPYIPEGPGWDRYDEPQTAEYLYEHLVTIAEQQMTAVMGEIDSDWQLFVFVHTLVDRTSHPYWPYMNADHYTRLPTENTPEAADAVRDAYRRTDADLGRLLEEAGPDTYVVIGSDHGFKNNRKADEPIGTHDLDGIYLVAGPGVPHRRGPNMHIEDIAPTLLYLLDLPTAQDMKGELPGLMVGAMWPPKPAIPTYEGTAVPPERTDLPVDQETWEALRGLGYVDGAIPNDEAGDGSQDEAVGGDDEE